jgi:hypothetical protein
LGGALLKFSRAAPIPGYLDKATRGTLENYQVFAQSHPSESFGFQQGQMMINWQRHLG